jgi:hypothetical protein
MKLSNILSSLVLAQGALAASSCGWKLDPNDCICMNSVDGHLEKEATATCCKDMGLKNIDNVRRTVTDSLPGGTTANPGQICGADYDTRQTFKDCCKWLNLTSVIGHCR